MNHCYNATRYPQSRTPKTHSGTLISIARACIGAYTFLAVTIGFDRSVPTGRSDLSTERNRVDSITTSNEFDTPFHYEDVAIC